MGDSEPPVEETKLQARAASPLFRSGARLEWKEAGVLRTALVEERMVLGSSADVGVVLHDAAVSRLHLELDPRADGLWVRDLGSRNGTYLDGVHVIHACAPPGALLRVGNTQIRIELRAAEKPVELWPQGSFGRLIGRSAPMRELFATLSRLAPLNTAVLVQGETGTGKELVAQAIHDASPRASKPFIVVDCAALPENLLEAELFGHTRGAFTGAVGARVGAIEAAEGGTVFLDEIGELPIAMQPKLLRALESHSVRRIGDTSHRTIDVRFISATHRDLLTMVSAGEFREDLYFRLAVLPVRVPPLRERGEDIESLVEHFWREGGGRGRVDANIMRDLLARAWRGNVRELRNFVERVRALGAAQALALSSATARGVDDGALAAKVLAGAVSGPTAAPSSSSSLPVEKTDMLEQSFKTFREAWIEEGERRYVRHLLEKNGRNVASAAREAEVDRTYLYRLIRKHDL
jgi:two-component system response regulator GlrR